MPPKKKKVADPSEWLVKLLTDAQYDSEMRYYTCMVNAELAEILLSYNSEPETPIAGPQGSESTNRNLSPSRVDQYATDMEEGDWVENSQPVTLSGPDKDGDFKLIDGQHRLRSVLQAARTDPDIEVPLVVCLHAPLEAMMAIDTGRSRSNADFLRIEGFSNAQALASAVKLVWLYREVPFDNLLMWRRHKLNPVRQRAFLADNRGILQGLKHWVAYKSLLPVHVGAAVWYLMAQEYKDPFLADQFRVGLQIGAEGSTTLSITDPRWKLREHLRDLRNVATVGKVRAKIRVDGTELMALAIMAANTWLLGKDGFAPKRAHSALQAGGMGYPRLITLDQVPLKMLCRPNVGEPIVLPAQQELFDES